MSSRRPYELLERKVKSTIIAEPSAALAVTEPLTQRLYGVDWTYRAHNGRTAPTAIIPTASQLFAQSERQQLNFLDYVLCLLRAEVHNAGWQVHDPELWVIKVTKTCARQPHPHSAEQSQQVWGRQSS